ncbi:kinase-like domain-containing protein [Suillus fuscotomentosus]|uniref:Kinase-like domain-containing protein n=1 Tax=Suillus fuscotomentosus TaxID=1912939 RepID=A0AAD4HJ56_9AGAM|nr:kinase-like domain-containing protein [Suillus fuscotomentosus]KAG1898528.1 kinase-like domain-containing protein [Suillus fuscotomentosus]
MTSIVDQPPRAPPIKKKRLPQVTAPSSFPKIQDISVQWIIGECVGKGASGRVRIAKHRRTGQLAAVKILPLQPLVNSRASLATQQAKSEKQRLGIDREIIMMKLMNHPNILRIYDVFEGEKELYLVLEYVEGGELFDFLVNRGRLPPLEALSFFKQIVYGLNYAHTFSIIHRDLKPENILIHSLKPPLIKLADWGMAAFAPPALQLETSCGSPHYASPEIVNGLKYRGNATDIWSCGVILFALLTGRLPFDDKNVRILLSKVKAGKYDIPAYIDPQAKDLLTRMLVVDVNRRITIPEIMAHPWFNKPTPGLHGDIEMIKADLLSSPGEGTLAKAFYFLLQHYREQTLKDHGIILDVGETPVSPGMKVITKQYMSPPPKRSVDADAHSLRLQSIRDAPPPPSRTPSPQQAGLASPFVDGALRARPPSPIGPRPPRVRPMSSPARPAQLSRSQPAMFQPLTVPSTPPMGSRFPGAPAHPVLNPCIIRAPIPVSAVANEQVSANSIEVDMQPATGSDPDWVNVLSAWHTVAQGHNQEQAFHSPTRGYSETFVNRHGYAPLNGPMVDYEYDRFSSGANKENHDHHNFRQPYREGSDIMQARGGLFGGRLNEGRVGRELRNSVYGAREVMKEKDKRHDVRIFFSLLHLNINILPAPALDLHPQVHPSKRSILGSPLQIPSPVMPSILASPVGEVKGWFSNLFNWKAHTYVLCSTDTLYATRNEAVRILEHFGVIVGLEETDGHGVLRCRMNDLMDTMSGSVIQKPVRFRVEFSSSSSSSSSPRSPTPASPRLPMYHASGPMSPTFRYGFGKPSLGSGFTCAILLVQEKGSLSSFRMVCRRLREEWALDALQSPVAMTGAFTERLVV